MKYINGVAILKDIKSDLITTGDLLGGLMKVFGISISSMPDEILGNKAYSSDFELFDPEKVENPEDLPKHWKVVWALHNDPKRKDCVGLRYRYVHSPVEIMPQYPRVPCKGIFVVLHRNEEIKGTDLVHIGEDVERFLEKED